MIDLCNANSDMTYGQDCSLTEQLKGTIRDTHINTKLDTSSTLLLPKRRWTPVPKNGVRLFM